MRTIILTIVLLYLLIASSALKIPFSRTAKQILEKTFDVKFDSDKKVTTRSSKLEPDEMYDTLKGVNPSAYSYISCESLPSKNSLCIITMDRLFPNGLNFKFNASMVVDFEKASRQRADVGFVLNEKSVYSRSYRFEELNKPICIVIDRPLGIDLCTEIAPIQTENHRCYSSTADIKLRFRNIGEITLGSGEPIESCTDKQK
jgi:hypothetical protein